MRFEGKTIVITGGGAGIGRRYAHRFASEGANVVIADLDGAAGERVVREVEALGAQRCPSQWTSSTTPRSWP